MVQCKVRDGRLDVEVPDNEVNDDEHLYHVLSLHGEVGQVRDSARVHGGCAEHIADVYVVNVDKLDKLPCAHVAELLDGGNAELLGVDVVLGEQALDV